MDAIIMAGGRAAPEDPLYAATGVTNKALLPIDGKPMIRYVAEALAGSSQVARFVVVGLSAQECPELGLPTTFAPAQSNLLDNVVSGFKTLRRVNPEARLTILSTADIPLLSAEMVDWLIRTCTQTDHDAYYTVVERSVMEGRFPGAGRTYVPLRGGAYCGADIFMARTDLIHANQALFDKLLAARKSFWKQVQLLGPGLLLRFAARRLTLADAERLVSRNLNVRGRAIPSPYAEMGMDVDKPHQLELVRAELARIHQG
jgi:molybdopterin-guanine dinucleotide biosynthesis protein A